MTSQNFSARRIRLNTLTAFRFFAALGVLAHHGTLQLVETQPWVAMAGVGRFGVDFFFVLSGFVLTWSYRPDRSRTRFYWLRFARVWPLHFVTFLLAIALIGGGPLLSALLNVLLLQSWVPFSEVYGAFNTPSWTLSVEAFFYLLFPFLIRPLVRASSRALAAACAVAWLAQAALPVIVHFVPLLWQKEVWFTVTLPTGRVPEFVTGMCVALLVGRGWRPTRGLLWIASFALAAMLVGVVALPDWTSRLWAWQLWSLPWMAVIVAAGAARDLSGAGTHAALVRLGDWSYALYLVHYPVLQWMDITLRLSGWAWVPVLSVASLILAGVAHEAVERPMERVLRRLPVGERHEGLAPAT